MCSPESDVILFLDEYGGRMQFECAQVDVYEHKQGLGFCFDIVCSYEHIGIKAESDICKRYPERKYCFSAQRI